MLFDYDFISLKFINKAVGGSITDPSYICSQNICNNNVSDVKNQRNTRDNRIVCQTNNTFGLTAPEQILDMQAVSRLIISLLHLVVMKILLDFLSGFNISPPGL